MLADHFILSRFIIDHIVSALIRLDFFFFFLLYTIFDLVFILIFQLYTGIFLVFVIFIYFSFCLGYRILYIRKFIFMNRTIISNFTSKHHTLHIYIFDNREIHQYSFGLSYACRTLHTFTTHEYTVYVYEVAFHFGADGFW